MRINDPKFRLNNLSTVITDEGKEIDFKLTKSQDLVMDVFMGNINPVISGIEYKNTGNGRVVWLKSRQEGGTTLGARVSTDMVTFIKNYNVLITAHVTRVQKVAFKRCKHFYRSLLKKSNGTIIESGQVFKVPTDITNNTTEFALDNNSQITVSLGATGDTIQHFHYTETAKNADAEQVFQDAMAALNNGTCIMESTAFGTTGKGKFFYDFWIDSLAGKTGFTPFFSPWFDNERYEVPYEGELFPEDVEKYRKYISDAGYNKKRQDQKLQWYINNKTQTFKNNMTREFPTYWQEAFLSSGDSIFELDRINELRRDPLYYDWDTNYPKDSKDVDEGLRIYRKPSDCVISIDPAGGNENGDYTSISVRDYERNLLAHYYGKANPEKTLGIIRRLDELGYVGVIVPELNATNGGVVMEKILNDIDERVISSQMYRRKRTQEDIKQGISTKYAFDTNAKTRKEILENFIDLFDRGLLDEIDDRELHEMTHFHKNDSGKMIASTGEHDDAIMCDAICLYVVEQDVRYMVGATDRDIGI